MCIKQLLNYFSSFSSNAGLAPGRRKGLFFLKFDLYHRIPVYIRWDHHQLLYAPLRTFVTLVLDNVKRGLFTSMNSVRFKIGMRQILRDKLSDTTLSGYYYGYIFYRVADTESNPVARFLVIRYLLSTFCCQILANQLYREALQNINEDGKGERILYDK